DSSRFWCAHDYEEGKEPISFDKQFVRNYVSSIGWNKKPPAPILPYGVVEGTRKRYIKAYEALTEKKWGS
ncbi:MAG: phosphoribosylaminoimidazolesuccinocarboxamide synthase, partial [Nanoarchaeota archaeon]|nr:phosphoribosylaminoimidazolesuccinocarboxamide synthase [Nanoarchaeota archaeon]